MFINLFITLASGGAVVISQYIGRKEERIDYEEKILEHSWHYIRHR